ncbi:MAG TPA: phosphoesterase [Ruminiclostridium sp.]|nr:phosphoesterase [Ruminiclostridium sp.]
MKCWVDLHIHSCLSPCAEDDMTPNNIVNMALLKGLDMIAVTDHNSARNAETIIEAGRKAGIEVVPGMELCTTEEVHLICLFPQLTPLLEFEEIVYEHLPPFRNREDIFGTQIIMDAEDQPCGRESRLLSGASSLDIETAIGLVRNLGGVVIPAHVNRESYSMLNTLGVIPEDYHFKFLEHSKNCILPVFLEKHPELEGYQWICSSDAHFLSQILEREVSVEIRRKSCEALLEFFR